MKIKYNIPMINKLKQKISNVKSKMKNNGEQNKVPMRYYALLALMLLLGVVTLSNNVRRYNKSKEESYKKYELSDIQQDEINMVNSSSTYLTAESSINTNEPSYRVTTETISTNITNSYISPVNGKVIKEFAAKKLVYSKTLDMWKTHPGVDIVADLGENVVSVCDGKVVAVENDGFYGKTIKVLDDKGFTFVYGNLEDNISLKEGDEVKENESIGKVGVSAQGELADESHLHFEIIKDNTQINPLDLIQIQE